MDKKKKHRADSSETECKVLLVGDSGCGKTALINRFVNEEYLELYTPTGFDKYDVNYSLGDGASVGVSVWDTSGSLHYDTVRPLSYQDGRVFLICFSIGHPDTLDSVVSKWSPEVQRHGECSVPVILCGCQSDLRNDIETISSLAKQRRIPVTSEQALTVSRQIGAVTYVETSARNNSRSVRDAFEVAVLSALGRLNKNHAVLNRQKSYVKLKSKSKLSLRTEIKDRAKSCSIM